MHERMHMSGFAASSRPGSIRPSVCIDWITFISIAALGWDGMLLRQLLRSIIPVDPSPHGLVSDKLVYLELRVLLSLLPQYAV